MLDKKMTILETPDGKYPVICDFNTLEYLQTRYDSILAYQNKISGLSKSENGDILLLNNIDVGALLDGLTSMINEGIDIQNESGKGEPMNNVTVEQTGRIMRKARKSLVELNALVLAEIAECIVPKKKEQSPQMENLKRQESTSRKCCLWGKICSAFRKKK